MLDYLAAHTPIKVGEEERVKATDKDFFSHPYLYMTGHGNVRFTDEELDNLRQLLLNGGFLHADDCYGMDKSFRREMKRLFPDKELVELPHNYPLFSAYYKFPDGCPKIHEHDGLPAQVFGIFDGDRLMVAYTYQTDLGDGWEDQEVHHDPPELHEAALKMGVNIIYYALSQ